MKKKEKTLEERYSDDILTDNTALKKYQQCKNCLFRDRTTVKGVECGWQKGNCEMFIYPDFKPDDVMRNLEPCEYHEKDTRNKKD